MAQSGSGGFSVTISAVDQISRPLGNIGKELSQLSRQFQTFQKEGAGGTPAQRRSDFFGRAAEFAGRGSREVGRGLREIGHLARETGENLHRAFEPLAALGGVGGIAGGGLGLAAMAEGLTRLGESAQQLQNLSNRTGVATKDITSLSGAAVLAGSSAEAMASGIETLGQKLYDASLGRDAGAIALFKQLHIHTRDLAGNARTGASALAELSDRIRAEKNPLTQVDIATQALGTSGRDLLPVLLKGGEALERLRKEGEKLHGSQVEWVRIGNEFNDAQDATKWAVTGLYRAIGAGLQEDLKPAVIMFGDWLSEINNSPEKLKGMTKAIEGLGLAFGTLLVGGIAGAIGKLNAWWALPAIRFLLSGPGAALTAPLALKGDTATGPGMTQWDKDQAAKGPGFFGQGGTAEKWLGGIFGGSGRSGAGITPIPPLHQPGKGVLGPASFDAIARAEGTFGKAGIDYNMLFGGGHAALTDMNLSKVMGLGRAAGGFQEMPGTIGDAAKALGMDPNATKFTPENQRSIANWIHGKQGFGAWSGFGKHPEELRNAQAGVVQPGGGGFLGAVGKFLGIGGAQAAPMPGFGGANMRTAGVADFASSWWGAQSNNPGLRTAVKKVSGLDPASAAWCAAFANAALASQGIAGSGSNIATSFEKWGKGVAPGQAARGDIMVLPRGLGPGQVGGHVGIATGESQDGMLGMISGNSGKGHGVNFSWEDPGAVMVRRAAVGGGAPDIGGGAAPIGGNLVPGGALDSKHSVSVDFNNAPQGMRARIGEAKGPADVILRTNYAFGAV